MRIPRPVRFTPSMGVALLALLLSLGGYGYASGVPGHLAAAKHKKTTSGHADAAQDRALVRREAAKLRGPSGLTGTPGPTGAAGGPGPAGVAGQAATKLFADVDETQSVRRATAGVTISRLSAGNYKVLFAQDVSQCVAIASPGLASNNGTFPDEVVHAFPEFDRTPSYGPRNPNSVAVYTHTGGAFSDAPFNLAVFC